MSIHIDIYIHTYIHIYIHIYIYTHIKCISKYIYTYIRLRGMTWFALRVASQPRSSTPVPTLPSFIVVTHIINTCTAYILSSSYIYCQARQLTVYIQSISSTESIYSIRRRGARRPCRHCPPLPLSRTSSTPAQYIYGHFRTLYAVKSSTVSMYTVNLTN